MSKVKYKVHNWSEYNEGLMKRGAITIWISPELLQKWRYKGQRQQGGQLVYSNTAIEVCLMVRKVYHLSYRQTQGFILSFFGQPGVQLPVPDYTRICRRSHDLCLSMGYTTEGASIDILVDSTGRKVFGEGEWKVRVHGWSKHRRWMKLHVALDAESQVVLAAELTTNAVDDAAEAEKLLEQIDGVIDRFTGDEGYDTTEVREALQKRAEQKNQDLLQVIAPQKNAVPDKKQRGIMKQRDDDIAAIKKLERTQWKIFSNYHQCSKAETFMYRFSHSELKLSRFPLKPL